MRVHRGRREYKFEEGELLRICRKVFEDEKHTDITGILEVLERCQGFTMPEEDAMRWLDQLVTPDQPPNLTAAISICRVAQSSWPGVVDYLVSKGITERNEAKINHVLGIESSGVRSSTSEVDCPSEPLVLEVPVVLIDRVPAEIPDFGEVVGVDMEWKPYDRNEEPSKISWIQIATTECVWLVDLLSLGGAADDLIAALADTTIIGYGLTDEFNRLIDNYDLRKCKSCIFRTLNLQRTHGLAKMVEHHLARKMDKTMQCSDWSVRPISPAQQTYAALDAYVLLPLAHAIYGSGDLAAWLPEARHLAKEMILPAARISTQDIRFYLDSHDVAYEWGASAVAKTIALATTCGKLAALVLRLEDRLCFDKVNSYLGSSWHLASVAQMIARFGYIPRTLGPLALRTKIPVVFDDQLPSHIAIGAGEIGVDVGLSLEDALRITNGRVHRISTD